MEIFRVTMEKWGLNSHRITTIFVVCFIALPTLLMVTMMYRNSTSDLFEGLSKVKDMEGKTQNVTSKSLEGKAQNITADVSIGRDENSTSVNVAQNVTTKFLGKNPQNTTLKDLGDNPQNTTLKVLGENAQNATLKVLEENPQNTTLKVLGENPQNTTLKVLGGRVENFTAGSKNDSFTGSKSDSSPSSAMPMDRLLNGLIAPGFDEGSCLSRYQSYLYGKTSHHKPSPYLISKLRNYEDLHKRCGPHTKSYKRTIRKLAKSSYTSEAMLCNYIVWLASNGLGNRIVSMASAFLYAVLTDRVLLVQFHGEMDGLFCEPFPDSSWLLPRDFPHKNQVGHLQTYKSMLESNSANSSRKFPPSFLYLNLEHSKDEHDKCFHCDHSQALLQEIPALFLKSDQYFVPSLFMTPSFKQELSKMFPEKETVFHHLGRYLFHPSNEAWGLISRFYQAYLANADERIGLQIRVFNNQKVPYQTVMDQILSCTLKHKVLPEVNMQKSAASPVKNQTSKAVLVASLYSEYAENLRNMYWTKPTVTGETVGVYQPSHEEYQKFNDNFHNMKAWAEIYLLSLCDVLVTSAQSTFGYAAQSLGGLKPWILHKTDGKKIPEPPCIRALSMEPCYHFPPKNDCKTKTKLDVSLLFPHMRPCEDLYWGVKLVGDHE